MRQLVPTSNEVPALLEQVSTAARRVGLDLAGVEPEPVVAGDQFDTYRYKISVTGDYHALGAFMANVGSLTRIVAPMNVQLKPQVAPPAAPGTAPRRGTRQLLDSEFQIQTYVARAATASTAPRAEESPE
jgi:type IV pilus assembly protein PilO